MRLTRGGDNGRARNVPQRGVQGEALGLPPRGAGRLVLHGRLGSRLLRVAHRWPFATEANVVLHSNLLGALTHSPV